MPRITHSHTHRQRPHLHDTVCRRLQPTHKPQRVRNTPRPSWNQPKEWETIQTDHPRQNQTVLAHIKNIPRRQPNQLTGHAQHGTPTIPTPLQPHPTPPFTRPKTPSFAYTLIPKAQPNPSDRPDLWRVRYEILDEGGNVSLRYGDLMMHLGIGRAHHRTPVMVLVHGLDAATITYTGEVLAEHRINPKKIYQPKR